MELLNLSFISILGGDQTFYGILTTTLLLCFFFHDENFLYYLLKQLTTRTLKSLKSIFWLKIDSLRPEKAPTFQLKRVLFQRKIKRIVDNHQFIEKIDNDYAMRVVQICEKAEIIIAPQYTFLYCLVVFMCELLLSFNTLEPKYIITFLFIFTFFSTIFWTILWIFFLIRTSNNKLNKSKHENKIMTFSINGKEKTLNIILWVAIVYFLLHIITIFNHAFSINKVLSTILFLITISLPTILMGIPTCRKYISEYNNYSEVFIYSHLFSFFILSLISVFLFFLLPNLSVIRLYCEEKIFLTNISYLSFVVYSFTILNGLLFPICFPYFKCLYFFTKHNKKIMNNEYRDFLE